MRKLTGLVLAVAFMFGMRAMAVAQATYTWSVITTPGAHLIWPNQGGSPNIFESEQGLLGRVVVAFPGDTPVLGAGVANACGLLPGYDCQAGNPPVWLLAPGTAEGPVDLGGASECNRAVVACNALPVPSAGHAAEPSHAAGLGSYSYLVIHKPAFGVSAAAKGLSFVNGDFVIAQELYRCNDCPAGGFGKDINDQAALDNTGPGATVQIAGLSLWTTQALPPFGHAQITLQPAGAGAGKASACGKGIVYQGLDVDLCVDGLTPGGNFTIPDQKALMEIYSVSTANHASFALPQLCNPPDCYIENVIIPAALAANPLNQNVMVQRASSVLPPDAPGGLADNTVDSLLYFATTQLLDVDGDGAEDRVDPCPNDPANGCLADLAMGGSCAAGTVFCTDSAGVAGCRSAQLCWTRRDTNADCFVSSSDIINLAASALFNVPVPVGPFDP